MEYLTQSPPGIVDQRPRKRQRRVWDVLPENLTAQLGLFCAQEAGAVPELKSDKEFVRFSSPPLREDDKNGRYVFAVGDNLTSRLIDQLFDASFLVCVLGTFGQVLECWDRESKEMVAIKIIHGIKQHMDDTRIEIGILQQLGKYEPARSRCVQVRNWFEYRNHICIVFEKLGPSLFDFLRENNYRGFPIDLVREFARQLLDIVAFLHDLRLIHTDLKPENVLLVSPEYIKVPDYKLLRHLYLLLHSPKEGSYYMRLPKSSSIKVIDFGGTTVDSPQNTYVVSTRHYRAPEVILGLGWGYPCDIWSVGCIIVELCSGDVLFQTHEDLEHLAMMEKVLGPLPGHMLRRADRHAEKFVKRGRLNWPEGCMSVKSMEAVLKVPRLKNIVRENVDHSASDLVDLLHGLLRYDPSDRLSAREALRHPFFTRVTVGRS
ncbi:serine/threonine-protein kinase AFC2-like protein [Carex littledalei]|uniref:dual-specificity kinase n=1 Tax=Carex littledalei TaxID=544730 RepID=A0A833VI04_9POAL|nr:serine/threonine-protein kinase AFC2-like protein [Carex littledalei]